MADSKETEVIVDTSAKPAHAIKQDANPNTNAPTSSEQTTNTQEPVPVSDNASNKDDVRTEPHPSSDSSPNHSEIQKQEDNNGTETPQSISNNAPHSDATQPSNPHNNSVSQQQQQEDVQPIHRQASHYGYYPEDIEFFQVHTDIYNTYALLKSKMIRNPSGTGPEFSTLWDVTFSTVDKLIFYFFFGLVAFIQIVGFLVLYLDADEIATALRTTAKEGSEVYFNGGTIDFILPNNATLLTNHGSTQLNISSGTVQLFETNPKVPSDIDYSVLFTIVIADICMVFLFFKELTQLGQLARLTRFLPELHEHKTLINRLFTLKLIILLCASIASLVIIALATTSIEAMEKAVAIFFLFEISSWVYVLIRGHPEIHDDLYVLQIDLRQVMGRADDGNEPNTVDQAGSTQQHPVHWNVPNGNPMGPQTQVQVVQPSPQAIDYEQLQYETYNRVQHDFAFVQVFLMTVTFLCAYIGVQFLWWLPHPDFGGIMMLIVVVCVIVQCFVKKRIKTKINQLVQEYMLADAHKTTQDM
eukprot:198180_1